MGFYRHVVRPWLFRCDPERVHHQTLALGRWLGRAAWVRRSVGRRYGVRDRRLAVRAGGVDFANPLGLAAGFDKSGHVTPLATAMGFGHVEVGSVSAEPSAGNARPRLFRLPSDRAVVVNYGVPNEGARRVAERLARQPRHGPIGVNLVATNTGEARSADAILDDFLTSARILAPVADYLAINLLCPNSEAECDFFAATDHLPRLLRGLDERAAGTPVFLKIPAIEDEAKLRHLLAHADASRCVRGFGFNLLPGKPTVLSPLRTSADELARMPGAVAGRPCEAYVNRSLRLIYTMMDPQRYQLIAAGGVFSADDAYRKIRLGASLVQIYTGLIYEGPSLIARINRGLADRLASDGFSHLSEAVGADVARPAEQRS